MSTAMDMLKFDKERQSKLFERMMEAFLKEWLPEDHYMAIDFERDFHMLVRQIYRDAQEPLLDHITKLSRAMAMFPREVRSPQETDHE
jgi:hypothetical protein